MAVIEASVAFSSLYVAGVILFGSVELCEESLGSLALRAAVVALVVLVCLVAMGLYQFHQRLYFREAVVRLLVGVAASCVVLAVVFYAFPALIVSRALAGIAVTYSLVLLLLVRYLFVRTVDENIFRHRTLVYGAGSRALSIFDLRRRADRRGFKVLGRVAAPGDKVVDESKLLDIDGESITEAAVRMDVDEIVVAMDDRRGNLPIRDLLNARLRGIDVIDLLEFLERETGKIRVDLVRPGWLIFSPGFRAGWLRRTTKRLMDLFVSAIGVTLGSPVMLLTALAIKLEDGPSAPLFYRQTRVGQGGEHFEILKFRSMTVDAEAEGEAVWADESDSRVTRVGKVLRKFRADEVPQVFNVLLGHMSIVGPRPERPEFVEDLQKTIPYYSERHIVKPGITGWAQVRYTYAASEEDALEKLQYELYYIKNQSLMLDIMIILQTVEVVLWSKGAR
ncbi:MAG: TIGR03013 family PEP-CTERM/XrtA system glycosyltransferase [Gammaproteobacteria bacterium]|nr:TIGR03013 family PEP-CTERM/XrtA system glycosyltransferase [Gammaproteobacteria bacterium]